MSLLLYRRRRRRPRWEKRFSSIPRLVCEHIFIMLFLPQWEWERERRLVNLSHVYPRALCRLIIFTMRTRRWVYGNGFPPPLRPPPRSTFLFYFWSFSRLVFCIGKNKITKQKKRVLSMCLGVSIGLFALEALSFSPSGLLITLG